LAHLAAVHADLDPIGYVEAALAERVALHLWKLGRLAQYERDVATFAIDEANRDVGEWGALEGVLEDDVSKWGYYKRWISEATADRDTAARVAELAGSFRVRTDLAVVLIGHVARQCDVDVYEDSSFEFPGWPNGCDLRDIDWNAASLRQCIVAIGDHANIAEDTVLAIAVASCNARVDEGVAAMDSLKEAAEKERQLRVVLPESKLATSARYEAHLERALGRSIQELQRLKAMRAAAGLLS
jgi:hypothetical protein